MASRKKRPRRSAGVAWEIAFEAEVRQRPAKEQVELLRWLRRWRRGTRLGYRARSGPIRPPRVFRVISPTGGRYLLF
jgi:hypothetical protein